MRLIDLFEDEPIDLAAFRKRKASNAFHNKMGELANEIPDMFATQAQQEAWFNNELDEIRKRIDEPLKRWRMEIRPLTVNYDPNITIIENLYLSIDRYSKTPDAEDQLARKFIKAHRQEILTALERANKELRGLTAQADKMEWPAPWRRYTRYSSFAHELSRYNEFFGSKLFEDGRIVKNVNTTVDVNVDEIPRQAKKFGFKTTIGGEPPLLQTNGKNLYQQD